LLKVAVQFALWALFKVAGAQVNEVSTAGVAGAVRVRLALWVPPFSEAVMVVASSLDTALTMAVNWAALCPDKTVTEPGTVTCELLSANPTMVLDATADTRVAVQVAVPAALKVVGAHVRLDRPEGATKFTWAVRETPFKLAVTVTV
jgi:hypothetical protein